MTWQTILFMIIAWVLGWITRDTLDFKIRCDRFCREIEREALRDSRKPKPPEELL